MEGGGRREIGRGERRDIMRGREKRYKEGGREER